MNHLVMQSEYAALGKKKHNVAAQGQTYAEGPKTATSSQEYHAGEEADQAFPKFNNDWSQGPQLTETGNRLVLTVLSIGCRLAELDSAREQNGATGVAPNPTGMETGRLAGFFHQRKRDIALVHHIARHLEVLHALLAGQVVHQIQH